MNRDKILQHNNVAVITGAALGIGKALSMQLAKKGLSVVMADLNTDDFQNAIAEVRDCALHGPDAVAGIPTDVSDDRQIENLKSATLDLFGTVHLLVNNAVTRTGRGFDADRADWRRALDVNLWGPILGVDAFLPTMLASPDPGAIVNVASKQGITNPPGHPIYNISKSALKTYTEALEHELRSMAGNQDDSRVSTHLLVPGWTTTGHAEHKPGSWLPDQVVERLLDGIARDRFYIVCPDDEVTEDMDRKRILWAAQDITEDRPPLSRWHPDFAAAASKACS